MSVPRVKFCWECGNKFRGNYHVIEIIDGYPRTLHKLCAKRLLARPRNIAWGRPEDQWQNQEEFD